MNKREFQRKAWRAVKAFVSDNEYESVMDDLTVACSDSEWKEVLHWIELAREILDTPEVKEFGANPLPLIRRKLEQ